MWHALGLESLTIKAEDGPRGAAVEIVRLQDADGNLHEVRINHAKRTVSLPVFETGK